MSKLIECNNIWKRYGAPAQGIKSHFIGKKKTAEGRYSRQWALEDISFNVDFGSSFAIVGHNGTGKSTLLSLLLGAIYPDKGEIKVRGRVSSLLELGAGFHPELTGRENIFMYGSILGMTIKEIRKRLDSIIAFSELDSAIDNPLRTYSNGMVTRLGFSTIIHTKADLLLIDEVLAVGDARFQNKCRQYLHEYKSKHGSLIIVSHDILELQDLCDSGLCMEMGKVYYNGEIKQVIDSYNKLIKKPKKNNYYSFC